MAGVLAKSRVELPESEPPAALLLGAVFLRGRVRLGATAMPCQGVWTADGGELPPWKGDYHHDLNTQMMYSAYQTAGRFDQGLLFSGISVETACRSFAFARKFYDAARARPCRA